MRERDLQLERACWRIVGYLNGMAADGCNWWIWDKHKFHAATKRPPKSGRKWRRLSVSYLEKVFRVFRRRFADAYAFEEIRIGRSWRWKIVFRGASRGITHAQVCARLGGYARSAAEHQSGPVHIDRQFMQRFAQTSGLPLSMVQIAARKLRRVRGLNIRRRGHGAGQKLVVSLQQLPPPHSSPSERRVSKPLTEVSQAGSSSAYGASRAGPARWLALGCRDAPLPIGGRVVTLWKLRAKGRLIARDAIRAVHVEGKLVWYREPHAANFAYWALREGHLECDLVEAWRQGVARSSDDAVSAGETKPREPSAASAYARRILAADKRTADERWREFFAGPVRARPPTKKAAREADVMPAEKLETIATIEKALAARGLTMAALMRLDREKRDELFKKLLDRGIDKKT